MALKFDNPALFGENYGKRDGEGLLEARPADLPKGFLRHDGNGFPYPDDCEIDVLTRGGKRYERGRCSEDPNRSRLRWKHGLNADPLDVVAYKPSPKLLFGLVEQAHTAIAALDMFAAHGDPACRIVPETVCRKILYTLLDAAQMQRQQLLASTPN